MRAVIDLLATFGISYSKPLTEKYPDFLKTENLAILECELDKYYYKDALESVKKPSYNNLIIRDLLSLEIDIINIKTVLRMIRDHIDPEEAKTFLIEGGKELDPEILNGLLSLNTIKDVFSALESTQYRFLSSIPESALRTEKISVIEKSSKSPLSSRVRVLSSGIH